MANIIDGKLTAALLREDIRAEVTALAASGRVPGLAVIIVGENPASQVYVRNKKKGCEEVGIHSEVIALPEATTQDELLALIGELNERADISGILVQLPLPPQISETAVNEAILPEKDVDVFHASNVGKLMLGNFTLAPCTPAGVVELIRRTGVNISGSECVVIGRSNIVGKPVAMLMLRENATVTLCHSRTKDLAQVCRRADILIAAIGKPKFIKADMIKPGAVVIDVGINRGEDGKLCGDVDFEAAKEVAGYITPVPGGVGPMTITMLLRNTVTAFKAANGLL